MWYNLQVAAREVDKGIESKRVRKKLQKTFKNLLTNALKCDIIIRSLRSSKSKKKFKKLEKSLKNLLTNEIECDIIYRLSARQRVKQKNRSLKIEQQQMY